MRKNYELRITNYEWGRTFPHSSFIIRHLSLLILTFAFAIPIYAQVPIVTMRPDRAAPGMNVVVEVLLPAADAGLYWVDALNSDVSVNLIDPSDTNRVMIGTPIISWHGRVMQIPIFVLSNASLGPVAFSIFDTTSDAQSDTVDFYIDSLQHLGPITHDTTIGDGFGVLSASNTILVDSLIVTNAKVHFSLNDPDTLPGNPRLLPVVMLSKGPVRLTNSTIFVDADSVDGGPGGGGGGHGWGGAGGVGYTGGGSCPSDSLGNDGSASAGFDSLGASGGGAATGVGGGESNPGDQGGGGGTGAPYGSSGSASLGSSPSTAGGFGGGSGGGEAVNPFIEYGGGGGGFGTIGMGGGDPNGQGANGGATNGGRFLVPMAGGSGGGAGNTVENGELWLGASGGGGGGALQLSSFDSIIAISSMFSARGDSGTTGLDIAAGGGGGSGGAIYLVSTKGIRSLSSGIDVSGGLPGRAASSTVGFAGGLGGLGRVRIDGATNLTSGTQLAPVWSNGISLSSQQAFSLSNGSMHVMGYAQDFTNTLDTIRIYYRTRHEGWRSVDTLRAANGSWSKWLPVSHDSLLFVVAFVEVSGPASDPSNFEPSWLVSNASMGIITQRASPFLVVQDTLNFGNVRTGKCKTLALTIHNDGEVPLTLGKGALSGSPGFSITPDSPLVILPYASDTLTVEFCPDSSGADSGTIRFLSNDSANSPKVIVLFGTGLVRKDSLAFSPKSIHFDSILIGNCESDTIILLSAGIDTLFLDQKIWNTPPFSMKLIPPDTALAPKQKDSLIITFCPTDSGDFRQTQFLDERQDSIVMEGVGVIRRAASLGTQSLGVQCLGRTIAFMDTISNLGNDTITLRSRQSRNPLQSDSLGVTLQPHQHLPINISWVPDSDGIFADTLFYQLSDTILTTVLAYRVAGAELRFDSVLQFPFVCAGSGGEPDSARIRNVGPDTLTLSNFVLRSDPAFTLFDSTNQLLPGQEISLHFTFNPSDTLEHFDTLHFTMSDAGCDSTIAIVLTGRNIDSGLAAEPIDFDSVLVNVCRDDSTVVENPCGPAVTIDSVKLNNPAFQLLDSLPVSIPSLDSREVTFRFCPSPSDTGVETDTAILFYGGKTFRMGLRGIGTTLKNPWAHFTISSVSAKAGENATTSITLDSSSLKGSHPVRGVVSFDPSVVYFMQGSPVFAQSIDPDSVLFSTSINFDFPGPVEYISWMALLGPHVSTTIGLELTLSDKTYLNVMVNPGTVIVTDCTGLNGQLSPGGDYALGPVTPNPASDIASIPLTLGNDGYVEAGLYDMTGRLVKTLLSQSFARGKYAIAIPMDGLASARYMVVVHSLGWRAMRPLIIGR
jgi:hypothetical protein